MASVTPINVTALTFRSAGQTEAALQADIDPLVQAQKQPLSRLASTCQRNPQIWQPSVLVDRLPDPRNLEVKARAGIRKKGIGVRSGGI